MQPAPKKAKSDAEPTRLLFEVRFDDGTLEEIRADRKAIGAVLSDLIDLDEPIVARGLLVDSFGPLRRWFIDVAASLDDEVDEDDEDAVTLETLVACYRFADLLDIRGFVSAVEAHAWTAMSRGSYDYKVDRVRSAFAGFARLDALCDQVVRMKVNQYNTLFGSCIALVGTLPWQQWEPLEDGVEHEPRNELEPAQHLLGLYRGGDCPPEAQQGLRGDICDVHQWLIRNRGYVWTQEQTDAMVKHSPDVRLSAIGGNSTDGASLVNMAVMDPAILSYVGRFKFNTDTDTSDDDDSEIIDMLREVVPRIPDWVHQGERPESAVLT